MFLLIFLSAAALRYYLSKKIGVINVRNCLLKCGDSMSILSSLSGAEDGLYCN